MFKLFKEKENKVENIENLSATILYQKGLIELLNNDNENALKLFKLSLKKDSTNIDAYIRSGIIYREKGDFSRAIMLHNEILLRDYIKENEILLAYKSLIQDFYWCQQKQIIPPIKLLPIIKRANSLILNKLVKYLIENGFYSIVLSLYNSLSKNKISIPIENLYFLAGIEEFKNNNFKKALSLFKESYNISKHDDTKFYIGFSYFELNDYQNAYKYLNLIIHKYPYFIKDYEEILFKINKYSEIASVFLKIIETYPNNINALINFAEFKFKIKKENEAINLLKKAMDIDPEKAILPYIKMLYLENKNNILEDLMLNLKPKIKDIMTPKYTCKFCNNKIDKPFKICLKCGHLN